MRQYGPARYPYGMLPAPPQPARRGASYRYPRRLSGLGALGAFSEQDPVPGGTRLRLQANLVDALGVRAFFIFDNQLDKLSDELRKGGYRILKRTSNYSRVTYEVEVGIPKINMLGVLQDFTLSFPAAGIGTAANVAYDVLWHPSDGTPPPATDNTSPVPNDPNNDDDDGKGPSMTTILLIAVVALTVLRR